MNTNQQEWNPRKPTKEEEEAIRAGVSAWEKEIDEVYGEMFVKQNQEFMEELTSVLSEHFMDPLKKACEDSYAKGFKDGKSQPAHLLMVTCVILGIVVGMLIRHFI